MAEWRGWEALGPAGAAARAQQQHQQLLQQRQRTAAQPCHPDKESEFGESVRRVLDGRRRVRELRAPAGQDAPERAAAAQQPPPTLQQLRLQVQRVQQQLVQIESKPRSTLGANPTSASLRLLRKVGLAPGVTTAAEGGGPLPQPTTAIAAAVPVQRGLVAPQAQDKEEDGLGGSLADTAAAETAEAGPAIAVALRPRRAGAVRVLATVPAALERPREHDDSSLREPELGPPSLPQRDEPCLSLAAPAGPAPAEDAAGTIVALAFFDGPSADLSGSSGGGSGSAGSSSDSGDSFIPGAAVATADDSACAPVLVAATAADDALPPQHAASSADEGPQREAGARGRARTASSEAASVRSLRSLGDAAIAHRRRSDELLGSLGTLSTLGAELDREMGDSIATLAELEEALDRVEARLSRAGLDADLGGASTGEHSDRDGGEDVDEPPRGGGEEASATNATANATTTAAATARGAASEERGRLAEDGAPPDERAVSALAAADEGEDTGEEDRTRKLRVAERIESLQSRMRSMEAASEVRLAVSLKALQAASGSMQAEVRRLRLLNAKAAASEHSGESK